MFCCSSNSPGTIPSNTYNEVFFRFNLSVVKHRNECSC
jgi:hypothetical protein